MKRILFLVAFFAGVACTNAQYTLIKIADGVLVVSNLPERKFSVDVPGSTIVPYGLKQANHPFLTADNRILQIMSVPIAEFTQILRPATKSFFASIRTMRPTSFECR